MTKKSLALFDFDCTITTRDTLLPFLFTLHRPYQNLLKSLQLTPTLAAYRLGILCNHLAKEKLLQTFIPYFSKNELEKHAHQFAKEKIPPLLKPEALDRIRWHQHQQHPCYLISAGLEIYITPWANTIGFTEVLATQLVFDNDNTTGKIQGRNCFGPEKIHRLENALQKNLSDIKKEYLIYAYGDSRGDKELLAAADYAFYRTMPTTSV